MPEHAHNQPDAPSPSFDQGESGYIGRLAPAPTGALHLGNARTFLVAWLRARRAGGRIVLRLEDLDHPKVKPEAALDAYRDLAWLGLDWDAGPTASFPPFPESPPGDPYVQSQRTELYSAVLDELRGHGLVYPCTCTRRELETLQSAPNAGEDLLEACYPGTCRDRYVDAGEAREAAGREPAWRFRVTEHVATVFNDVFAGHCESVLSGWSGDFPVARGDRASYQLAVVVDDHAMGVTEVVRGDDLLPSTHRQLALYEALGYAPPRFCHVPLVVGTDGRRLAKRHGDSRLCRLRLAGHGPGRVLGWLAWSCGWLDELRETDIAEIARMADFANFPRERIVVTPATLAWLGM